jgi:hypothetical protein
MFQKDTSTIRRMTARLRKGGDGEDERCDPENAACSEQSLKAPEREG